MKCFSSEGGQHLNCCSFPGLCHLRPCGWEMPWWQVVGFSFPLLCSCPRSLDFHHASVSLLLDPNILLHFLTLTCSYTPVALPAFVEKQVSTEYLCSASLPALCLKCLNFSTSLFCIETCRLCSCLYNLLCSPVELERSEKSLFVFSFQIN